MSADSKEQPGLIDIPTAAIRLGIGVSTLRRKIAAGTIPAYRLGGSGTQIRLDPAELQGWLDGRRPRGRRGGRGRAIDA
jgi:excisionase family DNA binding protein